MVNSSDRCHICLEDIEFVPINLLKNCCDAFICNECWLNITDNNLISNCPICSHHINNIEHNTIERRDPSFIDNYEKYIIGFFKFISWIIVGYITFIILLCIVHYDNMDRVLRDIKDVSKIFYFWIIITPFGYIIQNMINFLICKLFNLNI